MAEPGSAAPADDTRGKAPAADADAAGGKPATSEGAGAAPAGDTEPPSDAEVCFICAEPVELYSVPPCNHRVCHICALRLRALWKKRECTFCKSDAKDVIFTRNAQKGYGEFTPAELPYVDEKLAVHFERESDYRNTLALLRFNCPNPRCVAMEANWSSLKAHVKREHSRLLCDLCVKHKKIFAHEHTLFTASTLQEHLAAEHRYCEYCREHFYSDDELWVHMRDRHEQCHICKTRSEEERYRYYRDYRMLEQHFKREHYLCLDPGCLEQKFVVFENQVELQVHQVEEHGKALSSRERRDALRVDASFYEDGAQAGGEAPSTSRRGRRRAREQQAAEAGAPSTSSSAPITLSSRRAQFGRSLTQTADAGEEEREKYWATVLTVLNDSQIKLTSCRSALQAYRASETSVQDLIHTVLNLTGESAGSHEIGTSDLVVQNLAEIINHADKRREMLAAWDAAKAAQHERFPALGRPAQGAQASSMRTLKNASSGNERVWESVARAASSPAPVSSHQHFPTLGDAASRNAQVPGSSAHTRARTQGNKTAWAPTPTTPASAGFPPLGGGARPTPRSVPGPRTAASGPRVNTAETHFPSLPGNAAYAERQAQKRELLGNARGRTHPLVPAPPPPRWGTRQTPAMLSSDGFPSLSEVHGSLPSAPSAREEPEPPPAPSGGGKQRRNKQILLSSVGPMHRG